MVASPLAFASPHSGLLVMVGALGSLVRVECVLLDPPVPTLGLPSVLLNVKSLTHHSLSFLKAQLSRGDDFQAW